MAQVLDFVASGAKEHLCSSSLMNFKWTRPKLLRILSKALQYWSTVQSIDQLINWLIDWLLFLVLFSGSELLQILYYSLFHLRSWHVEFTYPPRSPFRNLFYAITYNVQWSRVGHLGLLHGQNSHGKQPVYSHKGSSHNRKRCPATWRINGVYRSNMWAEREQYSDLQNDLFWEEVQ